MNKNMFKETVNQIDINYETNNNNVNFKLKFGKGKDSYVVENAKERTNYSQQYNIEVYEDNDNKGYRILCDDSPLVIDISNINIKGKAGYDYALGFAIDNLEPEYDSQESIIPNNIERDGTMWSLPSNDYSSYKFDQNPNGEYQWQTKKACEIGYKPTEKEKELGVEETTEKTGLIYITFMLMYKEKKIYESDNYRGATRSITRSTGPTRGGGLRGEDKQEDSISGRFGYGNAATTSSKKSEFKYLPKTERYVLPVRVRINSNSIDTNTNCSQNLKGANVNELKRKTIVVPF
jgi:hypothetical protein